MKKLKNRPLATQIWIIFTLVIIIVFVLLSVYFSLTIRSFFTNEIYKTIETAQEKLIQKSTGGNDLNEEENTATVSNDIRAVKHMRLNYNKSEANIVKIQKIIPDNIEAESFLKKLKKQVKSQTNTTQRYVQSTSSGRILYVMRSTGINKKGNFEISYMWDTYRNSLYTSLIGRLFSVMIIALIICLIGAKYMAQKLVLPLRELQGRVKKIGIRQWHESIDIDRNDEIGELSKSIEEMRKELVKQDEYEQTMLQKTSHDLKTPLMVIRSYAHAVEDGIYPKGDLKSTMKVIDYETQKMQKRVNGLLYLTKIKYMSKYKNEFKKTNIKDLAEGIIESFFYNKKGIKFEIEIENIKVTGDEEQWTVVFENIIENGLRYAKNLIRINIYEDDKQQYISIYNDGEKIPDDRLENIFWAFNKGNEGNFGLGLDIVKRIVSMYNGSIKAQNEDSGVSFIVIITK
ncbi:sensor histidine kinase [Clostridium estertheticum]|uniref:HAMP domain-containing sensor histidine kinase n=1 Tax=Clostridium estertheticum TaxID=238834 RepID=UPI001C6EB2FD|nr:sensor histidine kinase [Clostridium estertheticum]MBW9152304.1 GHKL domain-containing protein [Clostridium estertheticum]WLC82837.1 GHKL domain-containing protein [Clostridium estertheticum]